MIICDVDGCVVNNIHRAHLVPLDRTHTPNWTKFNEACVDDSPIPAVISLVKFLSRNRADEHCDHIVFLTSRGENVRQQTEAQLFKWFFKFNVTVIMRAMNDHRCTIDYKRDQLHKLSDQFSDDSIIIDDHPGIIKMTADNFPQINRLLVPSFDCTVING